MRMINLENISLKDAPNINEKFIQQKIYENPKILGLGNLKPIRMEKPQISGGRIDILLADENLTTRYEVELQLGEIDPSHLIRTIEYWDKERKRFPNYKHCAVIIAENVSSSRYLNVINLLNGCVPIIALQLNAFKIHDDEFSITFTKIVDINEYGSDDEDVLEPTDRKYWEKNASPKTLTLVDNIFNKLFASEKEKYSLNYTKFYIGLTVDGIAKNFVNFTPKKAFLWLNIKAFENDEFNKKLDQTDLDFNYDNQWNRYRFKIKDFNEFENNYDLFKEIIESAKTRFNI